MRTIIIGRDDIFGSEIALIDGSLKGRGSTEDDLFHFWRKILFQNIGCTTKNESRSGFGQHFCSGCAESFVIGGAIWLARFKDGGLKDGAKAGGRIENTRVDKVDHGEELLEVILDWSSRQDDPTTGGCGHQSARDLGIGVFQAVALVTDQQIVGYFVDCFKVLPVLFVAGDQHGAGGAFGGQSPFLNDFSGRQFVCLGSGIAGRENERVYASSRQPVGDLFVPIAEQRSGNHDQGAANERHAFRSLFGQRPDQGNSLQCLTQAHGVGQNAAGTSKAAPTSQAIEQKAHSLFLVWPQHASQ